MMNEGYFDFYETFFDFENLSGESWRNHTYYDNTKEPEGTWSGKAKERFTPEQRKRLDNIKAIAVDVEYEEIQG